MQEVFLRKLERKDKKDLLVWRNDEATRMMSFNTAPVGLEEHELWFDKAINDTGKIIYIAENAGGEKIGVIGFNSAKNKNYEANVNLNPVFRNQGMGFQIIREGCLRLINEKDGAYIIARVKTENTASVRAFTKAGFIKLSEKENIIEMYFKSE